MRFTQSKSIRAILAGGAALAFAAVASPASAAWAPGPHGGWHGGWGGWHGGWGWHAGWGYRAGFPGWRVGLGWRVPYYAPPVVYGVPRPFAPCRHVFVHGRYGCW